MVMSGSSTTLKAFKETDMMATARSLVSLLSAFVMFFTGIAFAALKTNGSITAWGSSDAGGTGAPSGSGYTKIYSTDQRVHLHLQNLGHPTP
jgi:hypothetical protein